MEERIEFSRPASASDQKGAMHKAVHPFDDFSPHSSDPSWWPGFGAHITRPIAVGISDRISVLVHRAIGLGADIFQRESESTLQNVYIWSVKVHCQIFAPKTCKNLP
jgi:hypothetical protein